MSQRYWDLLYGVACVSAAALLILLFIGLLLARSIWVGDR